MEKILVINPGSTSMKVAVYENNKDIFVKKISHTTEEIKKFDNIIDQYDWRKNLILEELRKFDIDINSIKVFIGRGGLVKPISSGVYVVNDRLKEDLKSGEYGMHASNLGGLIASSLAEVVDGAKAYIADPVVVDELDEIAKVTGHPNFKKKSVFHALNQKIVAKNHASAVMKEYEKMNLIVVHLGGGISVGAHKNGRVIDVNQALDGDGPFSPERSGTLPVNQLIKMCFSGKFSEKEIRKMIVGEGGMVAYVGTNDMFEVEQKIRKGDEKAKFYYEAMAYQIAKEIGAMATVLNMVVDSILITGGMAHDKWLVNKITNGVHKIAPVHVYPGEDEMRSLALNAFEVMKGEKEVKQYF